MLEGRPLQASEVVGGILPAIGIAMNLRSISKPGILLWYILGFILAVYIGLETMPIAIIAGIVAYLYTEQAAKLEAQPALISAGASTDSDDDDFI